MKNKIRALDPTFSIILVASITILIQLTHIYLKGHEICLNSGCEFIEKLTYIPSFFFNIIGLCYFLSIGILKLIEKKHPVIPKILNLVLISGASSEGILLSFQLFIAHHYCSYCIFLFFLILLLILLRGVEISIISISILISEIFIFSLLNFSGAMIKQINKGLVGGSFAKVIATSSKNNSQLFLIFSNKCPHCQDVLKKLPTNISIYLNPLSHISNISDINHKLKIKIFKTYNPNINALFIKIIKDKEIPLLIIKKDNNISFIEGDKSIIDYLKNSYLLNKKNKYSITNHSSSKSKEGCIFGTSCSEENNNGLF